MTQTDASTSVRPGHEIDENRLGNYLQQFIPDLGTRPAVRQFSGGQSNPTYLIGSPGRQYVLRKKPPGKLLPSAHQVEREYRVAKALEGTEVAVPRMIHLCEDESIVGTAFYVMEYCDGRIFRDSTLGPCKAEERGHIYTAMARTLSALHSADWKGLGLGDFGKPADYVRRQIQRWRRQFEASKTHEIPAMDKLMAWLEANIPDGDEVAIVHGDYRLENLVFAHDEPRIIAVLDWELSTLGHPLADLAHNCMPYSFPSSMVALGGIADFDINRLGIPDESAYIDAYCSRAGRSGIADWPFFKAFALFRTTAILQGVYARAQQNNASSADAKEVGALAGPVAEIGWSIASRA